MRLAVPARLAAVIFLSLTGARGMAAMQSSTIELYDAVRAGRVNLTISGRGGSTGDALEIVIQRRVSESLRLVVSPGTVFTSSSAGVQDMVAFGVKGERSGADTYRPSQQLVLTDDNEHTYVLEAYCLDFDKSNPGPSNRFTVTGRDSRAADLLIGGKRAGASIEIIQAALWLERSRVTPADLKARYPVTDEDIARARALVEGRALTAVQDDRSRTTVAQSSEAPELTGVARAKALVGYLMNDDVQVAWVTRYSSAVSPRVAIDALLTDPKPAVTIVVALLANNRLDVRRKAVRLLELIGDREVTGSVLAIATSTGIDVSLQVDAIIALGGLGDPKATSALTALSMSENEAVRSAAASALERIRLANPKH